MLMVTQQSRSSISGESKFEPERNRDPTLILFRFRQVPTFGRYTIRRFRNDVAAMKKLTGRDLKDALLVRLQLS
jgi:hypothetical protein